MLSFHVSKPTPARFSFSFRHAQTGIPPTPEEDEYHRFFAPLERALSTKGRRARVSASRWRSATESLPPLTSASTTCTRPKLTFLRHERIPLRRELGGAERPASPSRTPHSSRSDASTAAASSHRAANNRPATRNSTKRGVFSYLRARLSDLRRLSEIRVRLFFDPVRDFRFSISRERVDRGRHSIRVCVLRDTLKRLSVSGRRFPDTRAPPLAGPSARASARTTARAPSQPAPTPEPTLTTGSPAGGPDHSCLH